MALLKQDPSEVLGMTQDELKERLGKIDALESKLSSLDDTTKQSTSKMGEILSALEALKPKPEPELDDDEPDPLKPLTERTLANTIMLQHQAARQTFSTDFERWGTEIVKKMSELSADQQADPRVWKAMVLMVRGEHAADIEKDGWQQKPSFLEPIAAGLRPAPDTSNTLTGEERRMVKVLSPFGITPEKYQRGKSRLEKARNSRLGSFSKEVA